MSVMFQVRLDSDKLKKADKVTSESGTSLQEAVRMFVTEIAQTGKVPTSPAFNGVDDLIDLERRNNIWSELDDSEGW